MPSAPEILDNPRATRVTRVAGLARRQARERHERFLVEGPQGVREAVACEPARIHDLYVTPDAADAHGAILDSARDQRVHVHLVTTQVMTAMSADAQGLLAVVATSAGAGRPTGAEALTAVLDARPRLLAVLAEAQDPGNAGTMIRAADAAGADAVVLAVGSVDPTNPKVVRATAGSLFHLPVITGLPLADIVAAVRGVGMSVLAADGSGDVELFSAAADELLARPGAWLLGNEAHGLSPATVSQADAAVRIPLYGRAESLNVAAAATLCLYASARAQRGLA